MDKYNQNGLTISEKRRIIKAVKEAYRELSWKNVVQYKGYVHEYKKIDIE